MPHHAEIWECPDCGAAMDISGIGFYTRVACLKCGREEYVHTMLANFRIDGVLGVGGMSVVLKARDLVLDRPVAIKVLNEAYRDQPERIARFERESELMAKVRHRNVVSVYSAGWARKQFYIAMELISGQNLEIEVASGGLESVRALEITRQVAQGLDAAHRAGLLHRDMKPGNILIDEEGQARVLDFGLSLGTSDEDNEEIIWATPYYVPPETLLREQEDLRTDIYALGMTLRHLLTGNDKFPSAPQSARELIESKRNLAPLRKEMPRLHPAYCDLVDHMTRFNPAERHSNYKELLTEIAEVQAVLAERGGSLFSPQRRRRAGKAALRVLGTLLLGGLAGAGVATWLHLSQGPGVLVSPKKLDWDERNGLNAAEKAMLAGNSQRALGIYRKLSRRQGEPTATAWAALHAYMLLLSEEKLAATSAERDQLLARFNGLLDGEPASAGRDVMEAMREMREALRTGNTGFHPQNAVLRAAHACLVLGDSLGEGSSADQARLKREAVSALRAAGKPYETLARELDKAALPGH